MHIQLTEGEFDYEPYSPTDRRTLIRIAKDWRKAESAAISSYFSAAQSVSEAREILNDSQFSSWTRDVCYLSRSESYKILHVWERFKGYDVALWGKFSRHALRLLGHPETPEKSIQAAIRRAKGGDRIGDKQAAELIEKYKPKPSTPAVDITPIQTSKVTEVLEAPTGTKGGDPCPACGCNAWDLYDDVSWQCANCHHEEGEPAGDLEEPKPEVIVPQVEEVDADVTVASTLYKKLVVALSEAGLYDECEDQLTWIKQRISIAGR